MRLRPSHILAATVVVLVLPIVVTLALGGELRDLPWGAMALIAILGVFVARQAGKRAPLTEDDDDLGEDAEN